MLKDKSQLLMGVILLIVGGAMIYFDLFGTTLRLVERVPPISNLSLEFIVAIPVMGLIILSLFVPVIFFVLGGFLLLKWRTKTS